MRCQVWTVNRREYMRRVIGLGVDGIITNHPDRLRAMLAAVGSATEPGAVPEPS